MVVVTMLRRKLSRLDWGYVEWWKYCSSRMTLPAVLWQCREALAHSTVTQISAHPRNPKERCLSLLRRGEGGCTSVCRPASSQPSSSHVNGPPHQGFIHELHMFFQNIKIGKLKKFQIWNRSAKNWGRRWDHRRGPARPPCCLRARSHLAVSRPLTALPTIM